MIKKKGWGARQAEKFWRRCVREGVPMICMFCDKPVSRELHRKNPFRATIDHLVPRSKGGGNHFENLVIACYPCNIEKGTKNFYET